MSAALFALSLLVPAFMLGAIFGAWHCARDARRWAASHGWCPQCGRDLRKTTKETP